MTKNAYNKITHGKDDNGEDTRKYNSDGNYTDTYSDGQIQYYDKDNKQTGGKLPNGSTWTTTYNPDESYKQEFQKRFLKIFTRKLLKP